HGGDAARGERGAFPLLGLLELRMHDLQTAAEALHLAPREEALALLEAPHQSRPGVEEGEREAIPAVVLQDDAEELSLRPADEDLLGGHHPPRGQASLAGNELADGLDAPPVLVGA